VQNLRQAVGALHGRRIPAGEVFSFWRHVDRPTSRHGFVVGRELREGCLVASIGGGLCQLSNALYAAAIGAGCEVIERHRHSRVIPGSLAEVGLDATIFWNYVDLRFRPSIDLVIEARLSATDLILNLRCADAPAESSLSLPSATSIQPAAMKPSLQLVPGDCLSCGETSCVYVIRERQATGQTAWLLDEYWPEFDHWQQAHRDDRDTIHLPLDGQRWQRHNYAWTLPAAGQSFTHPLLTWWEARRIRATGTQGADRQLALIARDQRLAAAYHSRLPIEADRLVVSLNLLPHLWRLGSLGGRRYDVLMTRAPLHLLQQQLSQAASLHPASPTLRDFRAPDWLLAAEQAALAAAGTFITPHGQLAADLGTVYPGRVRHLNWSLPQGDSSNTATASDHPRFLFPASGLARKGAYEIREAMAHLPATLRVLGRAQDTADFWYGLVIEQVAADTDPLAGIAGVVLPAFVEHQPRLLLRAITRGIPVICSPACGLAGFTGVTTVPAGDSDGLKAALANMLSGNNATDEPAPNWWPKSAE
jgi:hypothetical protein